MKTRKPVTHARRNVPPRSKPAASNVSSNTLSSGPTTHIKPKLSFRSPTSSVATVSFVRLRRVLTILLSLGKFTTTFTSTLTCWSWTRRTSTAWAELCVWASSATAIWMS